MQAGQIQDFDLILTAGDPDRVRARPSSRRLVERRHRRRRSAIPRLAIDHRRRDQLALSR
jgi:hypothetical protein